MANKKEIKELNYEERISKAKDLETRLIKMEKMFEKHARKIILEYIDIGAIPVVGNHNYGNLFNDCQMNYDKYKSEIREKEEE